MLQQIDLREIIYQPGKRLRLIVLRSTQQDRGHSFLRNYDVHYEGHFVPFLLAFSGSAHKKQTHTESVVIIEGIGI